MPVFLGSSNIGYVRKIIDSSENSQSILFLSLKNAVDTKHICAKITTINFLSQEQAVILERSKDIHDLDNIGDVPQIYYESTFRERLTDVFNKIDIQNVIDICNNFSEIITNIKNSSNTFDQFINALNEDILTVEKQKEIIQYVSKILFNVDSISTNLSSLISKKTCNNIASAVTNINDASRHINCIAKNSRRDITKSLRTISACVDSFSKKPLKFLKNGLQQDK